MPGGRPITGADVHAQLRRFGPPGADAAALRAALADDAVVASAAALAATCPPERIGLTPGAFAALFEPLFGEFE